MPSLWMWVLTVAISLWALLLAAALQSVDDVKSYLWEECPIWFFFNVWRSDTLKTQIGAVFHQTAILRL